MTDTSTLLCKKVEPTNSGALVKDSAHPFIEVPSLNSALTEVTYSLGVMDVLQGSPTASEFLKQTSKNKVGSVCNLQKIRSRLSS